MLTLGIMTSMFTSAMLGSRALLTLIYGGSTSAAAALSIGDQRERITWNSFTRQTNFPFMATRRIWYTLSAVLMIASLVLFLTRGLNLTVDFTGGTSVEATFSAAAPLERVRTALEEAGFHEPTVQGFGTRATCQLRLAPDRRADRWRHVAHKVDCGAAQASMPQVQIKPSTFVGPQVGDELRNSAIKALAFTLVLVFIYIALRFHTWRLSAGAILALLHDPILIIGWFALTQTPFDLAVVAALLAVVGLFAQRHHHRVRPHPRALRGQPAAAACHGRSTSRSTRRCRARS